jgi:hypothetical protein
VLEAKPFFEDGDQGVGGHGSPDLSFDGIGRGSKEPLYPQMLLDPLEEQFNLPSLMINRCHVERRKLEIIRQEDESFVDIGGIKADAAKQCREFPKGILPAEDNGLITSDTIGPINRVRTTATKLEIMLGTDNKVSRSVMEMV